ncbi:MAG: hypothetical protein ACRDJH_10380, partial [Thermomicrobiales bacterium]
MTENATKSMFDRELEDLRFKTTMGLNQAVQDLEQLGNWERAELGPRGRLNEYFRRIPTLSAEERKGAG